MEFDIKVKNYERQLERLNTELSDCTTELEHVKQAQKQSSAEHDAQVLDMEKQIRNLQSEVCIKNDCA